MKNMTMRVNMYLKDENGAPLVGYQVTQQVIPNGSTSTGTTDSNGLYPRDYSGNFVGDKLKISATLPVRGEVSKEITLTQDEKTYEVTLSDESGNGDDDNIFNLIMDNKVLIASGLGAAVIGVGIAKNR